MPQGLAPFCLVTMGPVKIAVLGRVSAAIAGLRSQRPWPPNVLIILDTSEDSLYGSLEGIELPLLWVELLWTAIRGNHKFFFPELDPTLSFFG